jgi:hypothetical protein
LELVFGRWRSPPRLCSDRPSCGGSGITLLDSVSEPYTGAMPSDHRLASQDILTDVLYAFDNAGNPRYSMALCGRAKKNWIRHDEIRLVDQLVWVIVIGDRLCFQ